MQRIILSFFIFALTACSATMPKQVDIPISVKEPAAAIPPKPILPISKLNSKSKPNEVIKAYSSSVVLLEGYSDQLIKILKGY